MMSVPHSRPRAGRWSARLGALVAALALLLVVTSNGLAATVNIYDNAHVLNSSQVRSEASSLSYPISIYTVTNFTAGDSAFDQATARKITSNNLIVMAINATQGHGHIRIDGGRSVSLTSSDYQNAASAFTSNYNNGDYTGAAIAAIHSLRDALSSSNSGGGALPGRGGIGSGIGTSTLCCIGLLVLAGIAFFAFIRRRNRPGAGFGGPGFGGLFNRNRNIPPAGYDPNYNQPYGPYNQPYPPNYGPGYGNQGGMNPWAAGGLGAAAGGFLGYELGKEQGEREVREDWNQGNDPGNNFGGGDFGGGGGADFDNSGGGGGDFGGGGGGDFGGGGGGDFGGGGDSGGGSNF